MAVLSEEVYSPQNYIEAVTGKYYFFRNNTTILKEIQTLLCLNGFEDLWSYPLNEIEHIVENEINVVLVDGSDINDETGSWIQEYRWFEIPKSHINNFKRQ